MRHYKPVVPFDINELTLEEISNLVDAAIKKHGKDAIVTEREMGDERYGETYKQWYIHVRQIPNIKE